MNQTPFVITGLLLPTPFVSISKFLYCYNLEATGVGGVNLRPRDPSLDYTNSVWNCAKELAGGG